MYSPDQVRLLPIDPRDWLPAGHPVYQVRDTVTVLDLTQFRRRSPETRGAPGFDEEMMVSIILYAWAKGVRSFRKIAAMCFDDLGMRYLSGGHTPSYRTISGFYLDHKAPLEDLLRQSVLICRRAGLIDLSELFLDGTKIKANASMSMNVGYEKIDAKIEKLDQRIAALFAEIERVNALEDGDDDPDDRSGDARRERDMLVGRRERLLSARRQHDDEAKRTYEEHVGRPTAERTHNRYPTGKAEPGKKANMTDPDSRLMMGPDRGWRQAYNAQIVVEGRNRIIVGAVLTNEPTDCNQLEAAIDAVKEITGEAPVKLVADGGYFSRRNVEAALRRGVEVIMPPRRLAKTEPFEPGEPLPPEQLDQLPADQRMRAILSTQEGHDTYAKRKSTVETVYAMIKGGPGNPGLTQFHRRGGDKCSTDWSLTCAVHNLKRYIAAKRGVSPKQAQPPRPKCVNNVQISIEMAG
jgi:transposase